MFTLPFTLLVLSVGAVAEDENERFLTKLDCPGRTGMTSTLRMLVELTLEPKRRSIASGDETLNNGAKVVRGKDINQILYSCELEDLAEIYSKRCVEDICDVKYGCSTYAGYRHSLEIPQVSFILPQTVFGKWWKEKEEFFKKNTSLIYTYEKKEFAPHFAQMAYGPTSHVGCYMSFVDPGKDFANSFFCLFDKKPEVGKKIYEIGKGCADSTCKHCDGPSNLCLGYMSYRCPKELY